MKQIFSRLLNVVYLLFIVYILIGAVIAWNNAKPEYTPFSYKVVCNNGKEFDPTSKPIDQVTKRITEPVSFEDWQIKSECEWGSSYFYTPAQKLQKNYQIYETKNVPPNDYPKQISSSITYFIFNFLILEFVREGIIYVMFGYIPLRKLFKHEG